MRSFGVMAAAVAALIPASMGWAASPAQDFESLCLDTHADAAAAYRTADASGWTMATADEARTLAEVTGNPQGRTIGSGTPEYRLLSVSPGAGDKARSVCVLVARGDALAATRALEAALGAPASRKTNAGSVWNLIAVQGALRPVESVSPSQLAVLTLKTPLTTVTAEALENGAGVSLRSEVWSLAPAPGKSLPADAGDVEHFSAFIEQDGRRQPIQGVVHLKRRPFRIVFEGSPVMGYAVAAADEPHTLASKTSETQLHEVMNRFGVVADGDDGTFLIVNGSPSGPDTVIAHQYWADSAEDQIHRLGKVVPGPDGTVTGSHLIDRLVLVRSGLSAPVDKFKGRRLYLLVAGKPPLGDDANVDPKYATLAFD